MYNDEKDIPKDELIKKMSWVIEQGGIVYVKFTCPYCFSRQTSDTPNTFHLAGYKCEECGGTSIPDKYGMLVMWKI